MMTTYTFIFEYFGGTYIKQVVATQLSKAITEWANKISEDIPGFNLSNQKELLLEIKMQTPVPLTGLQNIWCLPLTIANQTHLLNIIATL